jgi:large conductance mechanosensitive channel
MKNFINEFKLFAMRGNVLDLAVGVLIGGAFSKIVSSLVADVITPLLSLVVGKINLNSLSLVIDSDTNPIIIKYGLFLQNVLDFVIVAFCIFVFIRLINRFKTQNEKSTTKTPEEVKLLTEIRDLLKKQTS